ncbi:MAG: cysteine--tRNA ligase [Bacteroidales bacterium]|jgi:cysteinyl-tRNA synthetase|nr:cysteine--tRNA ligase [Bacteroidales bacterium]MEE0883106.1 cysteine--tRNA ligase [Bacteroidales bacterium]MEE1119432.1 cysteine--tRNA ligase [Bacteroidales bacterium]MEE1271575.1 cysteine--tRNA ligase [Bacteroidales bacterium]MEE1303320.1 cysteine--tRNA ligase [Bacteroidales bacterium]
MIENTKKLVVYNTLSRNKEEFQAINPPFVGMYVCGPTVYGDAHLGHARAALTFDTVFRFLKYMNYKVRYVRNITDVGHLENDADSGEDKIAKKARLEQLEPMEVAQHFTQRYLEAMDSMNILRPSIQPTATGHIIDQIQIVEKLLENGYAYISNGSVYFDVLKYNADTHKYGILSNRVIDEMIANTRELDGQEEKRNPADFALWKKASPEHIMRWPSPWSDGFPGWHLECTAMSRKYLGEQFDIHGGGLDLLFPHHESEIAQSICAFGKEPAKYWLHNNMITIGGQKMGKSLGNFITLNEFFSGSHPKLDKAYSPMTIRFFILQAHYRSTLDFSNEALSAAEKGMKKLFETQKNINTLPTSNTTSVDFNAVFTKCIEAMCDDFNTPVVIANMFEISRLVNLISDKKETITEQDKAALKENYEIIFNQILGMKGEQSDNSNTIIEGLMNMIIEMRAEARANKDWAKSDQIRDRLTEVGITIKDGKEGAKWEIN